MTLSESQLWSLLIIVPSLASGIVSAVVAFLLSRQRGATVFRTFGWVSLALMAFGLVDGILAWSDHVASPAFLTFGFLDLLIVGALVPTLGSFAAQLIGRPWGLAAKAFASVPLVTAAALIPVVLLTRSVWTFDVFLIAARCILCGLFLAVLVIGFRFVFHWKEVHDREFRRIVAGTGILMILFVPLWLTEIFGHVYLLSFYDFLLVWNVGALTIASRAFFEPAKEVPTDLFSDQSLSDCVQRFSLTPREAEVASLHAQGYAAKDIGEKLSISPKTVRNHISNLYDKTGTGQRRELLALLRSGGSGAGSVLG